MALQSPPSGNTTSRPDDHASGPADPGRNMIGDLVGTNSQLKRRYLVDNPTDRGAYVAMLSSLVTREQQWIQVIRGGVGTTTRAIHYDTFMNGYATASGVKGMYGCTSVIIASNAGAFISHIWEIPAFQNLLYLPTSNHDFRELTFNVLKNGNPRDPTGLSVGFSSLTGPGGMLHARMRPVIFIITPIRTESERNFLGVDTELRFAQQCNILARLLAWNIRSREPPRIIGYRRTDQNRSNDDHLKHGKAIVEVDQESGDTQGAFCFCRPPIRGSWRLWVEDRVYFEQSYTYRLRNQKRDDSFCASISTSKYVLTPAGAGLGHSATDSTRLANKKYSVSKTRVLSNQSVGDYPSGDHDLNNIVRCKSKTCGTACSGPFLSLSSNRSALVKSPTLVRVSPPKDTHVTETAHTGPTSALRVGSTFSFSNNALRKVSPTSSPRNLGRSKKRRYFQGVADPRRHVADLSASITEHDQWVPHGDEGLTTTKDWSFGSSPFSSASGIKGVWGCTAVIVISSKGIFAAHIWENPAFIDDNEVEAEEENFWFYSYESLAFGAPSSGDRMPLSAGLEELAEPDHMLNEAYNPAIFIFTPLTMLSERAFEGILTDLRYEERIRRLSEALAGVVPSSEPPQVIGYARAENSDDTNSDELQPGRSSGFAGRAIVEADQEDFNVVDGHNISCFNNNLPLIGAWRLWYEDHLVFQRDYYHPAAARAGGLQKRNENDSSCGFPSNTDRL
ncbi:MAG: hypothetical protein Q9165_005223 [Trypethelium subeluteriae]